MFNMTALLLALEIALLIWLGWGAVYQLFFAVAGLFYKAAAPGGLQGKVRKTVVFIPAYREDNVILSTARAALQQNYPADQFDVVVIADGLKPATIAALNALPIKVVEVRFEKSTKSRALNAAIQQLGAQAYETAVVLDADNHMAPGFLEQVNITLAAGNLAVQGIRAPKHMQTAFAMLDAASESANNHILCRGHRVLGFSARLAGSGMAFDFNLFCQVMQKIDAVGGFDKEMELRLTQQGVRIAYNEQAIVLDEKVSKSANFSKQRSRWIAAQFKYAKRFLPAATVELFRHFNFDFFNKAAQMTLPPRLLLPGILLFGTLFNTLAGTDMTPYWATLLLFNLAGFAIALPAFVYQARNFRMWIQIPMAFIATLTALLHLKTAYRYFLVTPKND
jgi:cellulose synthase/poly-beta-1,6-N-acetylglucosamine synthase-like glycosyltransferase